PLKFARGDISLRMVESKTRKAAFLREAVRQLNVPDVSVDAVRVEQLLVRPELHESIDVITVRAVRIEKALLNSLQPFLKPDGLVFLFRSGDVTRDTALPTDALEWSANHMLLPHLQSRLVILKNVPRGT